MTAALAMREQPPESQRFAQILLASEGRQIPDSAIARVVELAQPEGASVRVLSIARVHGVAFGLPNPGLLPTKREWDEQREIVAKAVKRLKRQGLSATGHVLGTRKATKAICAEAAMHECEAIVMAADPDRNRFTGDMLWTQEPQRVRRRAKVPVFLVTE
ncbi:MAG: universal stress protein [Actinomycetota bacterium]|nr:universal stress protein [Actinomycetota bacterium]